MGLKRASENAGSSCIGRLILSLSPLGMFGL